MGVLHVDGNAVLPGGYVLTFIPAGGESNFNDSKGRGVLQIRCKGEPKGLISITIKAGRDEKHATSEHATCTWTGTHNFGTHASCLVGGEEGEEPWNFWSMSAPTDFVLSVSLEM